MRKTKFEKIKEILNVCQNVNEEDLTYIIGYAACLATKCEGVKSNG